MNITLHLWVDNMPLDFDGTTHYIDAANWTPPAGVTLEGQTLSGPAEETWTAYRALAAAVAAAGHGDVDDETNAEFGKPSLTACPTVLICDDWTCAAQSLAQLESREKKTWAEFVAAVPSLAKEMASAGKVDA